jgi:D-alanine--poly(phosphoribitol) ligase subunit 1
MKYYYNLGSFYSDVSKNALSACAIRYREKDYTYSDLTLLVDRAAVFLMRQGITRGQVIAIAHEKAVVSYALMLAALRLGVPYLVIDSKSPLVRLEKIVTVSEAQRIFCDDRDVYESLVDLSDQTGIPLSFLHHTELPEIDPREVEQSLGRMQEIDGATVAYIMFTSGSTGVPKGVAITHENLMHFINWAQSEFMVQPSDVFTNVNPMYFDNSVFDFYVSLFSGATLTPISRDLLSSPYELIKYVENARCTIWFSVPSMLIYLMTMKAITHSSMSSLRKIIFGGEGYPKVELKKLFDIFSLRAQLVNVYGPTECTCICSAYTITENDFTVLHGLPPLGHLNINFDSLILDEDGKEAETGELLLIGPNVAAGYFNDNQRTQEAFRTLTATNRFGKRAYATGDIVRKETGLLYFVGRKDNQIKHMGYRIELEEIEAGLMNIPGISQAAVVHRIVSSTHGKLYGFVATALHLDEAQILEELAKILPPYMIPHRITICEQLPKNANGKIDRKQLLQIGPSQS